MSNKDGAQFLYNRNKERGLQSVSGIGSSMTHTKQIRQHIPLIIQQFNIKSIVDCPCGDWNWMQRVNLPNVSYLGLDTVEDIIKRNIAKYGSISIDFKLFDFTKDQLPQAELLICRDFFQHVESRYFDDIIENIRNSGCKYLLANTYPNITHNQDLTQKEKETGWGFRKINLEIYPFSFKNVVYKFDEKSISSDREQRLYEL